MIIQSNGFDKLQGKYEKMMWIRNYLFSSKTAHSIKFFQLPRNDDTGFWFVEMMVITAGQTTNFSEQPLIQNAKREAVRSLKEDGNSKNRSFP